MNDMTSDAQYEKLKRFLRVLSIAIFGKAATDPETDPIVFLEQLEAFKPGLKNKALKEAVADLLAQVKYWSEDRRQQLDKDLDLAGAPTVAEVSALMSLELRRVLKNGRISSEHECLVIQALIEGGALDDATAERLSKWVQAFQGI